MPYLVDMNTFWCDWQVVSGDTTAFDEYTTFKNGLLMQDGSYVYNMKELCDYQGYGGNRYRLFTYYQQFDDNIYGEYEFYKYTNDPNIYDYRTFWQNAASYLGGVCGGPPFNIALFGNNNTEAFYSSDSGGTFDNTSITIPTPLPVGATAHIIERSQTQNQYEAYFGSAVSGGVPSSSHIYKFDFATKEWTTFYTFTGPGRRIDDLLWVNAALFITTNVNATSNISKSTNGGATFTTSTLSPTFRGGKIEQGNGVIVIGGYGADDQRFLYSTDQGTTWNYCNSHTPMDVANPIRDLQFYSQFGVFVATFFSSGIQGGAIYVSNDGINWTDTYPSTIGFQPNTTCINTITGTIMLAQNNSATTLVSYDGGQNWVSVNNVVDNLGHIICIPDIAPFGRFITFSDNAGTGQKYNYSDDEGTTWTSIITNPLNFHGARAVIVY